MPKSNIKINKKKRQVYLDNASLTPLDKGVERLMSKMFDLKYGNPSSIHSSGVLGKAELGSSREEVARFLSGHKDGVIFTSGATEANNIAIQGVVRASSFKKPHIVSTNIEHSSVLAVLDYLEKNKLAEVTLVEADSLGLVSPKDIKKSLKANTVLVSVMYANNEIGTIQSIKDIAKEIRHFNKHTNSKILFHTDAVQAINFLNMNVEQLGVDMVSFNGAKIYGPRGVGVLYLKRGVKIAPIVFGGDQEFGLRPGTENIASIRGLSRALALVNETREKEYKRIKIERDFFLKILSKKFKNRFIVNGDMEFRLPNNLNITFPKIPSDLLVLELDAFGVMISSKSACKSGDGKDSHVILALRQKDGLDAEILDTAGSLRFSLGRDTKREDLKYVVNSLSMILKKLERWYY